MNNFSDFFAVVFVSAFVSLIVAYPAKAFFDWFFARFFD